MDKMIYFNLKLAGIPIGVKCSHAFTQKLCENYLTDELPKFHVSVSAEEAAAESAMDKKLLNCSEERLENLALCRKLADRLIDYDVLLFHGAALSVCGSGVMFCAPSGTGKSTHTALWRENIGKGGHEVFSVNDDKPLVRLDGENAFVYGSPWCGGKGLENNTQVPLRCICRLNRDTENRIEKQGFSDALPVLYRFAYKPPEKLPRLLELIERLSKSVSFYSLGCGMDASAATTAFEGMRKELQNEVT